MNETVYPNLSFNRDTGRIYVWHPRGPTRTEVHSFSLLGPAATPSTDRLYGPASEWTQHHCGPWEAITRTAGNLHARRVPVALHGDHEADLRAFYVWWQAQLEHRANAPVLPQTIAIGRRTQKATGD
jgi:Ring hydroxylating alpha subunit (catalytic domain)